MIIGFETGLNVSTSKVCDGPEAGEISEKGAGAWAGNVIGAGEEGITAATAPSGTFILQGIKHCSGSTNFSLKVTCGCTAF